MAKLQDQTLSDFRSVKHTIKHTIINSRNNETHTNGVGVIIKNQIPKSIMGFSLMIEFLQEVKKNNINNICENFFKLFIF